MPGSGSGSPAAGTGGKYGEDYSERIMPATLRRLPKGTYRFEHVLDRERRGKWR